MKNSHIEWTLLPESFAAPQFPYIACAVGLEMLKLMADVTERDPVGNVESQIRKLGKLLNVMSAQIPSLIITAFSAGEFISFKYRQSPFSILRSSSVIAIPLELTVFPSVMAFSSRCSLSRKLADLPPCFRCMLNTSSIRSSALSGNTHLISGSVRHF